MSDIFNDDFRDFIYALNHNGVEYILVGGYAVILHGYRRVTGDMDIWVNRTKENYSKLTNTFDEFGLPVFDMTESKFLDAGIADVFSYGRPPVRINIIRNLKALNLIKPFPRLCSSRKMACS